MSNFVWVLTNALLLATVVAGTTGEVSGAANVGAVLTVLSALASLPLLRDEARVRYANEPAARRLTVAVVRLTTACLWVWYGHLFMGSIMLVSLLLAQGAYMYAVEHGEVGRGQETKE